MPVQYSQLSVLARGQEAPKKKKKTKKEKKREQGDLLTNIVAGEWSQCTGHAHQCLSIILTWWILGHGSKLVCKNPVSQHQGKGGQEGVATIIHSHNLTILVFHEVDKLQV